MPLAFEKYHGLGNDFIVIEGPSATTISPERASELCSRHFGIGADGVLLMVPANDAAAQMIVINADGTRPEMCGNGLRCVALHHHLSSGETDFHILTDSGRLPCQVESRAEGTWIRLGLGAATDQGKQEIAGVLVHRISTGNPHAVAFGSHRAIAEVDDLGPRVSALVPGGCNVEFTVRKSPTEFEVIVWERGVGRTLACGTGAAATAAAAALGGLAPFGTPIRILLPGGPLEIEVEANTLALTLAGPAAHVFSGRLA